jgi:hypothetical protein
MSATAYERIIDAVRSQGKQVKTSESGKSARTQCPSLGCPAQSISLTIYDKRDQGKAKVVCFAGCSDELDILPALDMTVIDLYDEPKRRSDDEFDPAAPFGRVRSYAPDPAVEARIAARKTMNAPQRAADDLWHLPEIGEWLTLSIARIRPEFYISEREGLGDLDG